MSLNIYLLATSSLGLKADMYIKSIVVVLILILISRLTTIYNVKNQLSLPHL